VTGKISGSPTALVSTCGQNSFGVLLRIFFSKHFCGCMVWNLKKLFRGLFHQEMGRILESSVVYFIGRLGAATSSSPTTKGDRFFIKGFFFSQSNPIFMQSL
jgi:hypothetical protein